ncbi:MAG: hypothetical protein AAGU23_06945 [Bacillota bacterium]
MDELIQDFIKRSKCRYNVEQVKQDMENGFSLVVDKGFLNMTIDGDELHVVHAYVVPGETRLFKDFIKIAEITARQFNCRVIIFSTMRPKGFSKLLSPHGYKQVATVFGKEV